MAHTLYFLDKDQNTIWNTTDHYNDTHKMGISLGSATYTFDLSKTDVYSVEALAVGNFVVMKDYKDVTWCFVILEVQNFQNSYTIHCENLGLTLLNKVADKWPSVGSQSFAYYFDRLLENTGWTIGVNEIAHLKRTIEYEGRETALKRLLSLLNTFGAEIDFQVDYKMGQITRKVANIYIKRGVDRTAVQLVYNENLNGITKTSDMYDFATALAGVSDGNGPAGKDGNPTDLYLGDKDRTWVDPVTLYTFENKKGDKFIRCKESNDIFNPSGDYVEAWYESQAKSTDELFQETCLQLASRVQPKINYELDINDFDPSLNLGDTIKIVDHEYKPALYLSARLLELNISYTDETKNTAIFGNFKVLTSNIELKIFQLQDKINAITTQTGDTYFPSIAYANDVNGKDFTTDVSLPRSYMAIIYQLNNPITSQNPDDYAGKWKKIQGSNGTPGADGKTYYTWIRYADNVSGGGMSASPAGKKYIGIAYNKEQETPSTNPADYSWALMQGVGLTKTDVTYAQGLSGTVAPTTGWSAQVPTLVKGQYLWTKTVWTFSDSNTRTGYSVSYNAKDGNDGNDGIPGKDGVGISKTDITYAGSTSGTVAPTTGWTVTIPTVAAGSYLWTKTVWTYTDNTTETGYSVAKMGNNGAPGQNGSTSYTHYAWADSATGTVGFSLTQSSGKKYMGVYTDFTPTASTDPTKYKWVDLANSIDMGVRNLLLNSSLKKNTDQWGIALPSTSNGEYTLISKSTTSTVRQAIDQNVLNRINKNTEYTLSGEYYIESVSGANAQKSTIFLRTSDGVQTTDSPIHEIDITKTGQWISFSATGTSRPGTLSLGTVTLAISGDLIIKMRLRNFKLERGNKASDWTPAPEDTDASILALNEALANAKYPIVSTTQPTTGINGQQWWKVDANGNIIGFYIYSGTAWVPSKIDQSTLTIVSLNAVNITGANITGTTIKSSTMEITGSYVDQGATVDYTTKIDGPITQTWKYRGSDQHGALQIQPTRVLSQSWTSPDSSKLAWQWEIGGGGMFIQDGTGTGNAVDQAGMTYKGITIYSKKYGAQYGAVNLDYEDLIKIPFYNIPASFFSSNFTIYSTSPSNVPQCARNGRTVQLKGAFKPTKTIQSSSTELDVLQLPRWAWPAADVNQMMQASGINSYLLSIRTDGRLYCSRHRGWNPSTGKYDFVEILTTHWLNMAILYTAADLD